MLGFGALRAMNDAVKANRELLRGNKKILLKEMLTTHCVLVKRSLRTNKLDQR